MTYTATHVGGIGVRDPFAGVDLPAFLRGGVRPACIGHDPELWFDGDNEEAKRICRDCPLQRGCGEYGFTQGEWGVWAGFGSGKYRLNRSLIRQPITACEHRDLPHYAAGKCKACYQHEYRGRAA